jgi:hypothetical protein
MTVENYYRLETDSYVFYLTITKQTGMDTISIGGRKGECVNISVNKPDSLAVQRGYHSLDVATIPILAWDGGCAVDKDLARGSGTVHMINTILSEVVKRYPYVKLLKLTDNSHITCNNGKQISLMFLSIVEHSKTWYERQYGAFLYESSQNKKYKQGIQHLSDPDVKLSFDEFTTLIKPHTNKVTIERLKHYYENSPSYLAFFKSIVDNEGKYELCNLIVESIDIFLIYIFDFDPLSAIWVIPSSSIQYVQIQNEVALNAKPKNQMGGKRKSRRVNKSRVTIHDILQNESSFL